MHASSWPYDQIDQARQVAGSAERDLHVQLVAQRRRRRGAEKPRFEVARRPRRSPRRSSAELHVSPVRAPARPRRGRTRHGSADPVRSTRRTGRSGGAETLVQALCKLVTVAGTLDHEPQNRVLRRHPYALPTSLAVGRRYPKTATAHIPTGRIESDRRELVDRCAPLNCAATRNSAQVMPSRSSSPSSRRQSRRTRTGSSRCTLAGELTLELARARRCRSP